jgi:hypothetical protein
MWILAYQATAGGFGNTGKKTDGPPSSTPTATHTATYNLNLPAKPGTQKGILGWACRKAGTGVCAPEEDARINIYANQGPGVVPEDPSKRTKGIPDDKDPNYLLDRNRGDSTSVAAVDNSRSNMNGNKYKNPDLPGPSGYKDASLGGSSSSSGLNIFANILTATELGSARKAAPTQVGTGTDASGKTINRPCGRPVRGIIPGHVKKVILQMFVNNQFCVEVTVGW